MINFSLGSVTIAILLLANSSYGQCESIEYINIHSFVVYGRKHVYISSTDSDAGGVCQSPAHRCGNRCTWENVRVTYTTYQDVLNADLDLSLHWCAF